MKKIKKIYEFIEAFISMLILLWPSILIVVVFFVFAYLVSISNLPDWFKFFLLK